MDNSLFTTKDIVKYLVIGGLIYAILRMIPSQQIANKDLLLVMGVVTIGFITIDCLFVKEGFANGDPFALDTKLNIDDVLKERAAAKAASAKSTASPKQEVNVSRPESSKIPTTIPMDVRPESPKVSTNIPMDVKQEVRSEIKPEAKSTLPQTGCALEVDKVKKELEQEIQKLKTQMNIKLPESKTEKLVAKYFESLLADLTDKGILDRNDIENIQLKMRSKLLSMDEVIASLETLKKEGKPKTRVVDGKVKNDMVYNELPSDFYNPLGDKIANDWDNQYTILNTNKWAVPMPRPPVCINTSPCKVCPSDSSNYPVSLKEWDDSRYITQTKINKAWAEDQANAKTN